MNKEEWLKKGYVAEPVDKTLDLKAEINKLRKEKNVSARPSAFCSMPGRPLKRP